MGWLLKVAKTNEEKAVQRIYDSLTDEQKLFVAPKGKFVTKSPYLRHRILANGDTGFADLYMLPGMDRQAFLTMAVSQEHQGHGIGRRLLKAAIKKAKADAVIDSIIYRTAATNKPSLHIGGKAGKLRSRTDGDVEFEIDTIRNDWREYKRTKKIFDKLTREQQLLVDPEGTWDYSSVVFHRVFDKKNRGFAELYTQDDGTHEVAIAVDPKHQGKGLGKVLLQRLIEKANKNNIDEIIYVPLETNTPSVHLGAHFGGEPVEKTKNGNLKFIIDTNRVIRDKVSPEKRALIKRIINAYKEKYNIDLSDMKFEDSPIAYFNNGKKVGDDFNLPFGGSWTKKKKIYLNENMEAPMKAFGIKEDKDTFTSRIIAHELAHEIYNRRSNKKLRDFIIANADKEGFTTPYLKTVSPEKLAEETFAEYLADQLVSKM